MNNNNYWDKKIIEWEDSIRGKDNISFIERLASYFRNTLKVRTEMCLNILNPFAKDKEVLELGCGSGYFAFELYSLAKPKCIIGIDISGNAIKRAHKISRDKKVANKFSFLEGDVTSISLPEADITIGLGFLDYLALQEIKMLFNNIKSSYFLFTFPEKRFCLRRYIHMIYLLSQRCPKHFYYTKSTIADCINDKYGKIHFLSNSKLGLGCIVHNLPIL
jgi:SAM-dependent methyltransferase